MTPELGLAQTPEYVTEDVPDVLRFLQTLDEAVRNEGALKAFADLFEDVDVEDVKELITSLDTSNLESRYAALAKCINKAAVERAENRKRGHEKLLNILRDCVAYTSVLAFCDKQGKMSWEAVSTLLLNLVEKKGREGRRPDTRDVGAGLRGMQL